MHNRELQDLYSTRLIKSRNMRRTGQATCIWEKRHEYRVLVGEPQRRRPPEKSRLRWEDNFRKDF